jgi:hypothetical protein
MSEQRGLHNPDTHGTTSDGEPYCESCGVCDEGWRCRCCLQAEVEALRAQVQRVRDVCKTYHLDDSYPNRRKVVFLDRILRALDGDDHGA